ncbi:HU family DNA-binding protein [Burkholderia multivorans]|jgi:DNA-binding protein HU-beta|uniref:HU family DNA-binding protein n=1 Tax=Burkholderia multivorans TaxID=87883 RepID=UPI001C22FDA1|nr:HU family DNA-binding protein [Burkholderia multivorans]MBU9200217.1 HU family DNA-binding protein [Burkholderia multivorans]MDN8078656.1 HU family DNA-binding protein [Burkholderia multivorans]
MNKTELIAQVAEKTGQSQKVVGGVVDAVFEAITDAVAAGDSAAFVGFGTFSKTERPARTGRNPNTGEPIQIEASSVPKFAAGSVFKTKVKG